MLTFKARPGGAGDNFPRLGLNIAEADFLIFFVQRQMGVIATGQFAQRLPGSHCHLAIRFRGEGEDHFRGVNRRFNTRASFCRAIKLDVVQLAKEIDLALGIP